MLLMEIYTQEQGSTLFCDVQTDAGSCSPLCVHRLIGVISRRQDDKKIKAMTHEKPPRAEMM